MSLRDRWERLRELGVAQPAAPAGPPGGAGTGPGTGAGRRRAAAAPSAGAAPRALGLRRLLTSWGEVWFREEDVPAAAPRGRVPPGLLAEVPLDPLLSFGRVEAAVRGPEDLVFLDTETTGLAGGTGTLVVVAGLGRLAGDRLRIRQFVLVDPAAEAAFLGALAGELSGSRLLVTFNGRTFDWPVLESRYVLNRFNGLPPALPHLDLLHPARRLFGPDVPSCRLTDLETHVLGAQRTGDIPGSEVPLRYRELLDGRPEAFAEVLSHNRCDLETLVALAAHTARLAHQGLAGRAAPGQAGPTQLLALARASLERGDQGRAAALLERALASAATPRRGATWFAAARLLATLYRRLGRWDDAIALWSEVAASYPPGAVWALTELAKEREHRARDPAAALAYTDRALDLCRRRLLLGSHRARPELVALEHRRRRLLRRLGRVFAV